MIKTINIFLLSGSFLLGIPVSCLSQTTSEVYGKALIEVYKNETGQFIRTINGGKCWYMRYSFRAVASVYNGKEWIDKVSEEKGEFTATKYSRQVKSTDYRIFIDTADLFSIDLKKKTIIHAPSGKELLKLDDQFIPKSILDDSTLRYYNISKSLMPNNLIHYKMVALDKEKCRYQVVSFYYDEQQNLFTKVHIIYNKNVFTQIKESILEVHERTQKGIAGNTIRAHTQVFSAVGVIRPEYKQFTYTNMKSN